MAFSDNHSVDVDDEVPATAAAGTAKQPLQNNDVKDPSWRWPTRDKWFSQLEGIWRTVETTTTTTTVGGDGRHLLDGDPIALHLSCPFEVTTMVSEESKDMPDVFITLRSPFLISLLRAHLPDVLGEVFCCQEPEIDAKDLFVVRPSLRQLSLPEKDGVEGGMAIDENHSNDEDMNDGNGKFWTRLHLRHLLRFLDRHFIDVTAKYERMKETGLASYKMLWAFLTPGTEVRHLCSISGTDQYCVVHSRGKYVDRIYSPDDNCFKLKLKVMDYNGQSYRKFTIKQRIMEFDGEVPFQSLPLCPFSLFSPAERLDMEARFRQRGRLFYEYAVQQPFRYMLYRGSMSFYERSMANGKFVSKRINADGRVMIDLLSTARAHPDWPLDTAQPPPELMRGLDVTSKKQQTAPPSDEELKWAPAGMYGFSFSLKKWGFFDVGGMAEVSFNDAAYGQVVMRNGKQKEMLRAIVSAKLVEEEWEDGDGDGDGDGVDVVAENKGEGCVVLCYGPPGTGKTLTAEALAETLHKALWRVSAFELGEEPEDVEQNLNQTLRTASRWRALVLLDEADGYLEQRAHNVDIKRNLLTGVFLRLLEYYPGVLFLTTNRVRAFDTAILSRVSFCIRYAPLDDEQRRRIWRTLLERAGAAPETTAAEAVGELLARCGGRQLNGREIRNVVALARTWARARAGGGSRKKAAALEAAHVRDALDLFVAGSEELLEDMMMIGNQD